MPAPLDPDTRARAERMLASGVGTTDVAKRCGISARMARKIRKQMGEQPQPASPPPPPRAAGRSTPAPSEPTDDDGGTLERMPDAPPLVLGPTDARCDTCTSGCRGSCPAAWWDAWRTRLVSSRRNPFTTDAAAVRIAGAGVDVLQLTEWVDEGLADLQAGRVSTAAAQLVVDWRAAQAEALAKATRAAHMEMQTQAKSSHASRALALQMRTEYGKNAEPAVVGARRATDGVVRMLEQVEELRSRRQAEKKTG